MSKLLGLADSGNGKFRWPGIAANRVWTQLSDVNQLTIFNAIGDHLFLQVLRGNDDPVCPQPVLLVPPIQAYKLRVEPVTWHNSIAMRLELFGCVDNGKMTKSTLISKVKMFIVKLILITYTVYVFHALQLVYYQSKRFETNYFGDKKNHMSCTLHNASIRMICRPLLSFGNGQLAVRGYNA